MTSTELAQEALPQRIKRKLKRAMGPWGVFFEGFLRHPVMVGSIIPSSRFTINRMLAPVDWKTCKLFVEYGPGVGTFCRPVLDRLNRDATLLVIDTNDLFIDYLRRTVTDSRFIAVHGSAAGGDLGATVAVTVTNTGDVEGAEVVQVYVQDVESSVARPDRELKGFAKVALAAGASERVTIELDQRAFSFWSVRHARWVVEAGEFTVAVGPHSRDLPLSRTVAVDAPDLSEPLTRDSTLQEWFADPTGRQLIEGEVAQGQHAAVLSEELVAVIGNMPMSTLANFGGMSLDHDALDRITAQWRSWRATV
jgi:hypothetical protein